MKRRKAKRENKKRKTRRAGIDEIDFVNAVIRKLKGVLKWRDTNYKK